MRLGVFGTGYAGSVTAVGLAEVGHKVTAIDKDPDILARLSDGTPPSLFRSRSPDLSVGRQVFVKLSYLWRF